MSAISTLDTVPSITETMARKFGMTAHNFEATVRATCMQGTPSKEEFAAFLLVANTHGLNPLTREVYAYPKRGGGIQPIVSIDGWINLVNSHPQFDGQEFDETNDEKGALISVTCTMWRKDRSRPTRITEHLEECFRPTEPWKMKRRMLRHKAMIQCARVAFGFAGIVDPDEAEKIIDITPNGPAANAPARPKRADFQDGKLLDQRFSVFDHAGDEIGVFRPGRAAAMISGMITGKDPVTIVTVFERNRQTIAALSQLKIEVGDIVAAYDAAVKPSAEDEAAADRMAQQFAATGEMPEGESDHDAETGEIQEGEPDRERTDESAGATAEPEKERPNAEFWSRDSYAVQVPKTDRGSPHFPNWDGQMRHALADARTREELVKLDVDNGPSWQVYQLKLPDACKALREAFKVRAAELPA
jgi:phage recombination protein Bet